jgi:hypothetical protein
MVKKKTTSLLIFLVLNIPWTSVVLWKGMLDLLRPNFPKVLVHVKKSYKDIAQVFGPWAKDEISKPWSYVGITCDLP